MPANNGNSRRDAEIVERFCRGVPCSRIDTMMHLACGTARTVVIGWWYEDKMRHKEKAAASRRK